MFYALNIDNHDFSGFFKFLVDSTSLIITFVLINTLIKEAKKGYHKFRHLKRLYKSVKNFNSLVEGVDALDQAGRSVGLDRLENKEKVIEALTIIRADLIAALKLEKIFRENPDFTSNSFAVNLEPLQILKLSEQSSEYGRLFNEAIQIGITVQEEMQSLQGNASKPYRRTGV
ncbi:hypothetical protein [Moorena bouillonii]|uniref:Uncharacterized protein n=1 Tax=Moorena bouillonii PNG TaxID=568701 RepID=A0A1U7N8Y8_9CYAN|nr:hypothetical protein [Moorena bouillonii]OLT62420.1 hypothetical protein BJP37_28735 [Moorena bouillonii PNG]